MFPWLLWVFTDALENAALAQPIRAISRNLATLSCLIFHIAISRILHECATRKANEGKNRNKVCDSTAVRLKLFSSILAYTP